MQQQHGNNDNKDWLVPLPTAQVADAPVRIVRTAKVRSCPQCGNDEWISAVSGTCYSPDCRMSCDRCDCEVGCPPPEDPDACQAYEAGYCEDCYWSCRSCGTRIVEMNDNDTPYEYCSEGCCDREGYHAEPGSFCDNCGVWVDIIIEEPEKKTEKKTEQFQPGHGPCDCGRPSCTLCLCGDSYRLCGGLITGETSAARERPRTKSSNA